MKRLLSSSIALAAFVSVLAALPLTASADRDHDRDHDRGMHRRCARGMHWVPPHRNPRGRWVGGHCAANR